RSRLRRALANVDLEIVGEAPTLTSARGADPEADAFLVAPADLAGARPPGVADLNGDEPLVEALTPRGNEGPEPLGQGLPNKSIAARLAISDQTVKFHVASIYGKLGAANRTDAVRRALRRGIITI